MTRLDYPLQHMLDQWNASIAADRITTCPTRDWMVANVATKTMADFETKVSTDPVDGPSDSYCMIRDSYRYEQQPMAQEYQRVYAGYLTSFPFNLARRFIELLLHDAPSGGPWDDTAQRLLIATVIKYHLRAKEFLSQDVVRAQLPPDINVDAIVDPVAT